MNAKNKRLVLIIILIFIALIIGLIPFIDNMLPKGKEPWLLRELRAIKYFAWAWFPVLAFAIFAIAATLRWKPCSLFLRLIIVLLSMVEVVWALIWLFGIIMISTLKF